MSMTRRTIGVGAFILLAVIGTGWAVDRAANNTQARSGVSVEAMTQTSPVKTSTDESAGARPGVDTSPEYDRSDLLLSQG